MKKNTEKSRPKVIQKAIASIKSRVAQQNLQKSSGSEKAQVPVPDDAKGFGAGTGVGKVPLEQMDIYKLEITYCIEKNWAFSEQMTGGKRDLEAELVIQIMPDGTIRDIWFEKKSGNSYFDDSIYKAVVKSNPLPPLPAGFSGRHFILGLRFTPSGLR